jgi:AcrR family transcriptional regulator
MIPDPDRPGARYHHGDLRGALIAAGRELLEESGPAGLSLREAARRAGVSHAAPRYHFPSLRHFLGDCAADGFAEFDAALRAARADAATPRDGLAAMARAYVRFAARNRMMFRLMFDRDSFSEPTAALEAAGAGAYRTLVDAVRALDPDRQQPGIDYRVCAIWSIVHGFASLMLEDKLGHRSDAGAEDMAAMTVLDFLAGATARD